MKVLHVIDTLEVGGAEKSLLAILQRTRQGEHVVCNVYTGETLRTAFEQSGIRVVPLGLPGKYQYASAIRKLLAVLRNEKPNLVHTVLARSNFIGRTAGKIAGIPVISSLVNDSYSTERFQRLDWKSRLKLKITMYLDRTTARWVQHFIANSETVKASACRDLHVVDSNISVIYRGRDPSTLLQQGTQQLEMLRIAMQIPDGTPVILNVGRLIAQKAQKDLIHAAFEIQKKMPVRVLIAGEGSLRAELQELIQRLQLSDCVFLLGNRDDIPSLLALADVFVFPSYYEGHPGALLEAMFAARPIVASNIAVHREFIRQNETGILAPVDNPVAIAESVQWVLRHPEQATEMARRAREQAVAHFHIDEVATRHERIYEQALAQSTL
jgi:glycosyltransferase involved in cell wall biosynthesis